MQARAATTPEPSPPYEPGAERPTTSWREVPAKADVIVVGGGIVGVSAAWHLVRSGLSVVLVEKGQDLGAEQSGRNWGFVRQQGRDPLELPLAIRSNAIWQSLESQLDVDLAWRQRGNLALSNDPRKAQAYAEWAALAAEHGLDTKLLDMDGVRRLIPGLRGEWALAIYTASDGYVDPLRATVNIGRAAQLAGASILTECIATAIETSGGEVRGVRTSQGFIRATWVVLAGGIWSDRLARTAGVRLPQGIVINSVAAATPARSLDGAPGVWTHDFSFRPLPGGRLLLSAESATDADMFLGSPRYALRFAPTWWINRKSIHFSARRLSELALRRKLKHYQIPHAPANMRHLMSSRNLIREHIPDVGDLHLTNIWAGRIDGTPDGLPIIEALAHARGLVIATGFSGHGFAQGPATGEIVRDLVMEQSPTLPIAAFRLSRFSDGSSGRPRSLL